MIRVGPAKGAKAGIVLAHGRGGTAAGILDLMSMAGLSEIAAIAPEAPGQSWWPTSFLSPMQTMAPFVLAGTKAMLDGVAALEADGIARGCIWLGGFSQGACLALETLARHGEGLAGCFGFSGGLVGTAEQMSTSQPTLYGYRSKSFDYATRLGDAQVWISVHEQDPHIPLRRVEETGSTFRALGAQVRTQIYPGAGHAMMAADFEVLRNWLVASSRCSAGNPVRK